MGTQNANIIIQSRDLEILNWLANDFLLLTRRQIADLIPGRSVRRTNFRLHKLWRSGYISRRYPGGMLMARIPLYYLGPRAAEALGLDSQEPKIRLRRRQALQIKDGALPHFLLVNSVHVKFLNLVKNSPGVALTSWIPQYAPIWATLNQYGFSLRPDSYSECRFENTLLRFFIELDRGTERGAAIRRKIEGYAEYARSRRFGQHFSATDFRVLFITSTQRRAEHLLRIMASTDFALGAVATFDSFFNRFVTDAFWLTIASSIPQALTNLL